MSRPLPHAASSISAAIEEIFATVAEVRRTTLACHEAVASSGRVFSDADVSGLAPGFVDLLLAPGQVAVGLGIILEPGTLATHPLRLEWWQHVPGRDAPVALEVDLHPHTLRVYHNNAAAWFAVPPPTPARPREGPHQDRPPTPPHRREC